MRTGRRPVLVLLSCLLVALVGVFAALPTRAMADGGSVPLANFPDGNMRMLLRSYDTDGDGALSSEELGLVTDLDWRNVGIEDLTGIKYLTSLRTLNLTGNRELPTIDVSGMTELRELYLVGAEGTTTLNTTGCTKLEVLDCSGSGITTLKISTEDGSKLPSLRKLDCSGCAELTSVIVGNCDAILELYANDCPKLKTFDFRSAGTPDLSTLNVTRCAALEELTVNNAYNLTSVKLTGDTALLNINVMDNGLTSLDATPCVNATEISVAQNPLTSLDISTCTKLETLRCNYTELTSLDLTPFDNLDWFSISNSHLLFVAFSPSAPLSEGVRMGDQIQTYYNCASDENGWIKVDFAEIARAAGFTKFDPAKVNVTTPLWGYNPATGIASCSDVRNALGGFDYTYTDCGQVLENCVLLKTYPVSYSWDGAPDGVSLPEDHRSFATQREALASVSPTPARGDQVLGTRDGRYGVFTFSGWDGAVDETGADFYGTWKFLPIFYKVTYSWTNAPAGQTIPEDPKNYNTLDQAKAGVSKTPAKGETVRGEKDGKPGTYTFSGWSTKVTGTTVECTGSWTFVAGALSNKWTRVWGQDHYDTAAAVCRADKVFSSTGGTVVLATGESYWDALSASGLAGLYRAPILITPGSSLGSQARAELQRLRPSRVVVMGGWMAVSDSTLAAVRQAVPGAKVERCYGQAQDDTARAAFQAAPRSSWGDTCVVATSNGYWDALSIAPYAYSRHAPIFLTRGGAGAQNVLSPATMSAIRSAGFKRVVIVGGTMAVPASVESSLRSAGLTVTRLWGQDHYDTSAKIAEWELSQGMTTAHMAVSTGRGYWDALSGAALVGAQGSVVAIADDGHLQAIDAAGARVAGNVQGGYVLGGEMAVSRKTWDYLQ